MTYPFREKRCSQDRYYSLDNSIDLYQEMELTEEFDEAEYFNLDSTSDFTRLIIYPGFLTLEAQAVTCIRKGMGIILMATMISVNMRINLRRDPLNHAMRFRDVLSKQTPNPIDIQILLLHKHNARGIAIRLSVRIYLVLMRTS